MFRFANCAFCMCKPGCECISGCSPSCLITGRCVMAFQSYCYLRQSFIIAPQQMSVSKWHQLTNYKALRLIWHCAGSDQGLPLIAGIPKPLEHLSQQQENSPFGILLPFFMKWFRSANKGSLGQLNLCRCVPEQFRGIQRCDFSECVSIACVFLGVSLVKQEPIPAEETIPIFPKLIGSICVCLIDKGFNFYILSRKYDNNWSALCECHIKAA